MKKLWFHFTYYTYTIKNWEKQTEPNFIEAGPKILFGLKKLYLYSCTHGYDPSHFHFPQATTFITCSSSPFSNLPSRHVAEQPPIARAPPGLSATHINNQNPRSIDSIKLNSLSTTLPQPASKQINGLPQSADFVLRKWSKMFSAFIFCYYKSCPWLVLYIL